MIAPARKGALKREVHDALLEGLMDKRVKSAEIERKRLFGIPLEPEVPAKSEMRALMRRFELAFMRARRVHPSTRDVVLSGQNARFRDRIQRVRP